MFTRVVHLVPNSGLHFIEVELPRHAVETTGRTFVRERVTLGGQPIWTLKPVDDGQLAATMPASALRIDGATALKMSFDQWLPLPLLRYMARDTLGNLQFDEGPNNWARIFIAAPDAAIPGPAGEADRVYRAIIGLDTELAANSRLDPEQYPCPTIEDARFSSLFALSDRPDDIAGFLAEPWVQSWLDDALVPQGAGGARTHHRVGNELESIALYLTLLTVLRRAAVIPSLRFLASRSEAVVPRAVDLVIDVGAGRTTCLLVDHEAQNGRVDIESARLLPIRDFSQPGKAHRGAIESTVAFARATFGDEARSRHSGRLNAFHWPSLVRVGPEASRLVGATSDGDGMTGVVSPSRFLRDDVVTSDSWRFAVGPSVRARRRQMVVGRMLSHTTGQGLLPAPGTDASPSVVRPQFSLSAMSSFYFAELVLQALSAINTPVQAGEGGISEGRRALSRIVLCLASDMSSEAHEQACRRAEAAIEMLWRSLDWQTPGAPYSFDVPVVSRGLDATLGAQLAYLYDEIMQRYGGDVTAYLEAVGRHRPAVGMRPSLRIGAVDIGATGTRLTIATYSIERDQPLRPTVLDLVRDPIGGDDLIAAIVRAAVAPALRQALAAGAVGDVDAFLDPFIEAATKPPHGHLDSLASRFAAHWLRPAAAALLALDVSDGPIPERDLAITFDQLLAGRDSLDWTTAQRFEDAARAAGAVGFSLGVATIATSTRVLADTIAATTRDMVETIGASALASDCDLVLLTGWPGRLATIMALLRERMLWRPDRIVDLAGHHWQGWYPLSEAERAACDGKDVGLIGAVLARAGGDGLAMAARSDDNSTAQHWDHHDWSRHEEMRRTGEARA